MPSAFLHLARCKSTAFRSVPDIALSEWETNIFRFLRRVAVTTCPTRPVQLRVAGGWVRDKLLHRKTGDIDIAVGDMSGLTFASNVHSFAKSRPAEFLATDSQVSKAGCAEYVPHVSSVAVISPNPAMSRHLETAAVRLDGHDLDFVQLRTENYVMDSEHRIPQCVQAGTPQEDSMRRDFTVNALFYNLYTGRVEDFTGRGLDDLQNGVLRTPLEPRTTLLEDPLRALRAIRFACRLGFWLHPELCEALKEEKVRDMLLRKVSRERVGNEIMMIVESEQVVRGLELIERYGLIEAVFLDAFDKRGRGKVFRDGIERVEEALEVVLFNETLLLNREVVEFCGYGRKVLILASIAGDEGDVKIMLQKALRREKRLQQDVRRVIVWSIRLEPVVREWYSAMEKEDFARQENLWVEIAEMVRNIGPQLWVPMCIACSVRVGVRDLLRDLVNSGMSTKICEMPYVVDGKRLQAELGLPSGPLVGDALRDLMRLQLRFYHRKDAGLDHPLRQSSPLPDAEQCVRLLKALRSQVRETASVK